MGIPPPNADPAPSDVGAGGRVRDPVVDDRELVAHAGDDPEAFAALYRRYVDPIYRFAYRRTGSAEVAEDVTSATFEKALRSIDRFEWQPGGFRAWVYRIAANEVTDHHRRVGRDDSPAGQRALQLLAAEPASEADVGERVPVEADRLRAALARINPRYQEALSLRYLAGLSADETAAALGCSRSTLAVVLHRAGRALRRQLAGTGGYHR